MVITEARTHFGRLTDLGIWDSMGGIKIVGLVIHDVSVDGK